MKIRGLLLDVDKNPGSVKEVEVEEENLNDFYDILNCNIITIVSRKIGDREFDIVCDDEGLLRSDYHVSAIASNGRYELVGNLFICNHYKENLTSLSKEDIQYISNYVVISSVWNPESKVIRTSPVLTNVGYAIYDVYDV